MNNEFIQKLSDELSARLRGVSLEDPSDMERNVRAVIRSALGKLDLVTREEFEVQSRVLARSREKLEQLEKVVAELEQRLNH